MGWAAAVAVAAGGLALGWRVAGPEVRLGARSPWRPLSEGLRRAGREDVLSVGPEARLTLRGLRPSHAVRLRLAARPGDGERRVRVSCGDDASGARLTASPTIVALRQCPTTTLLLQADDAAGPRPYHLHEVAISRGVFVPAVVLPVVLALAGFAWRRRVLAAVAGVAVAIPMAVAADPLALAQYTRATQDRAFWTAIVVAALAALAEPAVRGGLASAGRWMVQGGITLPKVVLAGGAVLLVATLLHAPGLNGPSYWRWTWRHLDGRLIFPLILLASLPFFAARALYRRGVRGAFCLALMAAGVFALEAAALVVQPEGLDRWHAAIENPGVTGYFTDADTLAATPGWLATYSHRMWKMHTHARTKPPGPVLFYTALLRGFRPASAAAAAGALLIALLAAAAVPAVYALAREWRFPPEAAFESASLMGWSPGLILFLPEFDQTFPLVSCLLLIAWTRALRTPSPVPAAAFGVLAAAVSFFSYNFLVLGVAGLALAIGHPRHAARTALVALLVMAAIYGVLYMAAGFDPIATFRTALECQRRMSITWGRRYLPAVVHDPFDFALGLGWMTAALAFAAAVRALRTRQQAHVAGLAVLQIAAVDLSGLLRVEAARVWLLLAPFAVLPAGGELARWRPAERTAAFVLMAFLLAALTQNMTFIDLGPAP